MAYPNPYPPVTRPGSTLGGGSATRPFTKINRCLTVVLAVVAATSAFG
jgi:hypothetical protein